VKLRKPLAGDVWVIALVVATVVFFWWDRFPYLGRDDPASRLQAAARAGEGIRPLSLPALATFDWDRVVFFAPYTSRETAANAMGFDWPQFPADLAQSESFHLVVFTSGKTVVSSGRMRRCLPDVDKALLAHPIPRDQASFSLQTTGDCSVLRPAR